MAGRSFFDSRGQPFHKSMPRLTFHQCYVMLAGILSNREIFTTARQRLRPELFSRENEEFLKIAWIAALNLSENGDVEWLFRNREAAYTTLGTECEAVIASHNVALPPEQTALLLSQDPESPGFLHYVFTNNPESFDKNLIHELLLRFIRERAISDELVKTVVSLSDRVITDVSSLVKNFQDKELDLYTIDDDPVSSAAPEGWKPPPTRRRSTGISWLDSFLRGGHAAPETYGFLGVTGAGKTTFGLQLMSSCALQEQLLSSDMENPLVMDAKKNMGMDPNEPYEMKHCYYFHYEMEEDEIRKKLWSCLAMIDIDRIEKLGTPGFQLSTSGNLRPQDAEMLKFAAKQAGIRVEDFPGEQERLERAIAQMRRNMWLVDCSGSTRNPRRGTGYVREIHDILRKEYEVKKRKIAVVVIDYAGACVERHTADPDQYYYLLSQFGRNCEELIAKPFQTPVWIIHQLAAAEGGRTAAVKQTHANASGSKRFAENLWFCFNIGTADPKTGCRFMTASKARRANLGKSLILKIAGPYNRLVDVSSVYYQNAAGRFVPKDDNHAFAQFDQAELPDSTQDED